jgi:hypothetical protein
VNPLCLRGRLRCLRSGIIRDVCAEIPAVTVSPTLLALDEVPVSQVYVHIINTLASSVSLYV